MNHKFIPALAALLIVGMLLSLVPLSYAQTYAIGPSLTVVTIPQDDQVLKTGVMILGYVPATGAETGPMNLMSQYKITILYNGFPLSWQIGNTGPSVVCAVLEKDKVNVVADPKTGDGKQGSFENLMTSLVDVSNNFICKPRWKTDGSTYWSIGVLDVYYVGPGSAGYTGSAVAAKYFIADNILNVEAFFSAGRTTVFGTDIQDICLLGWPVADATVFAAAPPTWIITKPDGTQHYIWSNSFGTFLSCESLALAERAALGIPLATGQDPLWVAT